MHLVHLALLVACSTGPTDAPSIHSNGSTATTLPEPVLAWDPPDGAWDVAVSEGRLVVTAAAGGEVVAWEPGGDEEVVARNLGDPLGIALSPGGDLYVSRTDSGVVGDVVRVDPSGELTVLAEEGDGLLVRRPEDLDWGPDGNLLAADPGDAAWVVWSVDPVEGGASLLATGIEARAVTTWEGAVHVGTPSGTLRLDPGGPVTLDERPASGLLAWEGRLLAAAAGEGIYEVGGPRLAEDGPDLPGAMAVLDGRIYVVDRAWGGVWSVDIPARR